LSASIVIDPDTQKGLGDALEDVVASLRYGSITVNHWPALNFALGSTTWGAFPGHELHDIQSGIGVVHNTFLFDRPERSVVYGPFRGRPKPPWFVTHKTARHLGPLLARFEYDGKWSRLPGILVHALRG